MSKRIFFVSIIVMMQWQVVLAQNVKDCKSIVSYENHNQVDPAPLVISSVTGMVVDKDNVPIPNACVGLFTEKEHKLIAQSVTNQDGYFEIVSVPSGQYRLVARYSPFCTLNASLKILKQTGKHKRRLDKQARKRMMLYLVPQSIDSCSYIEYK